MSKEEYILQIAELILVQHVRLDYTGENGRWRAEVSAYVDRAFICAEALASRLVFEPSQNPRLR